MDSSAVILPLPCAKLPPAPVAAALQEALAAYFTGRGFDFERDRWGNPERLVALMAHDARAIDEMRAFAVGYVTAYGLR